MNIFLANNFLVNNLDFFPLPIFLKAAFYNVHKFWILPNATHQAGRGFS